MSSSAIASSARLTQTSPQRPRCGHDAESMIPPSKECLACPVPVCFRAARHRVPSRSNARMRESISNKRRMQSTAEERRILSGSFDFRVENLRTGRR